MNINRIKYYIFTFICLFGSNKYAQWGADEIWQQEFSRHNEKKQLEFVNSPQKVATDASGDFNLSIPLLQVFGRNNLDFNINLNYTPGITVTQQASFVGLGWDIPIGSIKRIPIYTMDNDIGYKHNLKDDVISGGDAFRDLYTIDCPYGSGTIIQIPYSEDSFSFELEKWRNWKITYDRSKERFEIITEDGTTMIFGMYCVGLTSNIIGISGNPYYNGFYCPQYSQFMEWKLTAILSANYIDGGGADNKDPLDSPSPATDNKGSWIAIKWDAQEFNNDPKKWNFKVDNEQQCISLTEITYPHRIITPTQVLEFTLEKETANAPNAVGYLTWNDTNNGVFLKDDCTQAKHQNSCTYINQRLKSIELYLYNGTASTHNDNVIKQVLFSYDDTRNRTTLNEVRVKGSNNTFMEPYIFTYYDRTRIDDTENFDIGIDPQYGLYYSPEIQGRIGLRGWYNGHPDYGYKTPESYQGLVTDGRVWNLKKAIFPTGGSLEFDYERDCYIPVYSEGVFIQYGNGVRLKSQTISDGTSNSITYSYSYNCFNTNGTASNGVGVVYISPLRYFRAFYKPLSFAGQMVLDNQLEERVLYEQITENNSTDQNKIKYYFNVRKYDEYIPSIRSSDADVIKSKTLDLDGSVKAIEYLNSNNIAERKDEFTSTTATLESSSVFGESDIPGINLPHIMGLSVQKITETLKSTIYENGIQTTSKMTVKEYDLGNTLPKKIIEVNSDGKKRTIEHTYPIDYTRIYSGPIENINDEFAKGLWTLKSKNIVTVIEKRVLEGDTFDTQKLMASELNLFHCADGLIVLPFGKKIFLNSSPVLANKDINNGGYTRPSSTFAPGSIPALEYDSRYLTQIEYKYDVYGNLIETVDANSSTNSIKIGYNNSLPILQTQNSKSCEVGYDDFEEGTAREWNYWNTGGEINADAHTGSKSWHFAGDGDYTITKRFSAADLNLTGKYIYSAWVKTWSTQPLIQWQVIYNNGSSSAYPAIATAGGIGEWQKLELTINLSLYPNITEIFLYVRNYANPEMPAICTVDDLKFYPVGSNIITYTYDPVTLQVSSESDANNIPKYYIYDGLQRIKEIRNHEYFNNEANSLLQSFLYDLKGNAIRSTNPNVITTNSYRSSSDYTAAKEFLDGLGRKIQSQVLVNGSESIVSHQEYDPLGRVTKNYKPYQFATGFVYQPALNVSTNAKQYYIENVYHNTLNGYTSTDAYPFVKTEYDNLNRIIKITPEGEPWQQHFMSYLYETNNSTDVPGYAANSLYKNTIKDENGVETIEFKDKFGQVVQSVTDADVLKLTTKFEYDILGNLTRTIPPKGTNLSTTYKYNTLCQLTQKISPDAGTVDYLYDKNGNIRLIRDSNHQGANNNNIPISLSISTNQTLSGSFRMYNRGKISLYLNQILEEIATGSVTFQIKGHSNVVLYTLTASSSNPWPIGSFILPSGEYTYSVQSTAKNSAGGNTYIDYSIYYSTHFAFVYNKYDNLNRIIETGEYETSSTTAFSQVNANNLTFPGSGAIVTNKYCYDSKSTDAMATGQRNLIGRISYTESYRLGVIAVKTFYSYNEMGNVEWMIHSNLNGYGKKISYTYDLQGNVTGKTYTDYYPGSSIASITNSYDKAGRPSTVKSKYRATSFTQEAEYQYFASGKLKRLKLGGAQGVDYRYNQRDWLTMINHQNLDQTYNNIPQDPGADGIGTGRTGLPADKFGMIIGYNTQAHIGLPQFQNASAQWNGNISWLIYRMKDVMFSGTDVVGYSYTYDKANRLRKADFGYYDSLWLTTNAYDEKIHDDPNNPQLPWYDKNGNLMGLSRNSSTGALSDSFNYNYPEPNNRLKSISGTSSIQYEYDGNGNVTTDPGKSIAFIIYDINNLPVTVYTIGGIQYQYYYDVNGNRVRKSKVGGSSTYYINGYDGKTEVVSHVPTGSDFTYNIRGNDLIGQVRVVGTTATRYYYLKDHLGNIRMTVNSAGNPVSWDDYYPFGSVMNGRSQISSADNRYKFTGKERDTETNYDYFGARYYDSRIARWLQVDPLAEKFHELSGYTYSFNNPIRFIDPNGAEGWDIVYGFCDAVVENFSGKDYRNTSDVKDIDDYSMGRNLGHGFSLISGSAEQFLGGIILVGGTGLTITTAGTASPISIPSAVGGTAIFVHGSIIAQSSANNLMNENKYSSTGGGKNSQHANQKARDVAKQKYLDAKEKYEKMKKMPNKTPELKKELEAAKKQMDHLKKQADFSGENHSQKTKGK